MSRSEIYQYQNEFLESTQFQKVKNLKILKILLRRSE